MSVLDRAKTRTNVPCDFMQAWHFDKGTIDGIDVTGRTIAAVFDIQEHLSRDFCAALYVDDGATDEQQQAILELYGAARKGGPVADLAKLVGEVVSIERVPITFAVNEGRGTLKHRRCWIR